MQEVRSGSSGVWLAPTRRRFLSIAALSALAAPGGSLFQSGAAVAKTAGRAGGFVIVNGWVLTEADLALLGDHAV